MRIVLDAMGSDEAPHPEVEGAVRASQESGIKILLVGDEAKLRAQLAKYPKRENLSTVHASEVIGMSDPPVVAVRKKKDASLLVGLRLLKSGEADAFVSAGNTGAVMVASRTILAPIKGVARSAICQVLPTLKSPVLVLDLGANVDCSARQLCQFAEMGMIYSRDVFKVKAPRVGLLNIGEEQIKGNEISKVVHRHLSAAPHINFIGNIEPKAMFRGEADVVVCDGFVGNVVLKTSEATASLITQLVKRELMRDWIAKLGAFLSRGAFKHLRRTIDPNEYPGAHLLGVNGTVIILHGASTARGIENGILGAKRAVEANMNNHIRAGIEELRASEDALAEELGS